MMEHQQLEQRTYEALEHARDAGLSEEDVSLLCWHCGIKVDQLRGNDEQVRQH